MGIADRKYFKRDILERVNKIKLNIDEIITLAQQSVMQIFIKAKHLSVPVSLNEINQMNCEEEFIFEQQLDKILEDRELTQIYERK